MFDDISKIADNLYKASWKLNERSPHDNPEIEYEVDERHELQCLALYDGGWRPDGFDYITNSYDIVTFWKKDGVDERKEVRLTLNQQRRWLQKIEARVAEDKKREKANEKKSYEYSCEKAYLEGLKSIQLKEDKAFINTFIEAEDKTVVSTNSGLGERWHIQKDSSTVTYPTTFGTTAIIPTTTTVGTTTTPFIIKWTGTSATSTKINNSKYCVFRLPKSNMPNKVYVSGRLITMGIIGSDVQAAYAGGNKLIFAPNELTIIKLNDKLTVSIDYGDFLYHYNVEGDEYGAVIFEDESNTVFSKLISLSLNE